MADKLHNALEKLTTDEQKLIRAIFFDEKSEREIARVIGLSQKAVNKRCHHILEKLKKIMNI